MNSLTTQTVQTMTGSNQGYAAPSGNMLIPLPTVMMSKPLSYEFRVAEFIKDNKIEKVALQVQVWEHDNYGAGFLKQDWTTVERVQITL
jgi:uncharacterized membrane protein